MRPESRSTSFSWPLKKGSSFQAGRKSKPAPKSTEEVRKSQVSILAIAVLASFSKAASSARPSTMRAAREAFTSVKSSTGLPGL